MTSLTSAPLCLQAGEEGLHRSQVHREALCQEEMSRPDVPAAHTVRRGQSPRHLLAGPGVRRGSGPHGAHPSGQRTCQWEGRSTHAASSPSELRSPSVLLSVRNTARRLFTWRSDWWTGRLCTLWTSSLRTGGNQGAANLFLESHLSDVTKKTDARDFSSFHTTKHFSFSSKSSVKA